MLKRVVCGQKALPQKGAPAQLGDSVVQEPGFVEEAQEVVKHPVRSEGEDNHEDSNVKKGCMWSESFTLKKGASAQLSHSVVQERGVAEEDSKSV